jgi:hypothetical protein
MLVDLTAQLDKTQRLLRHLLEAKHSTKSEQLSADQLQLFIEELNRKRQSKAVWRKRGTSAEVGA